MYEVSFGLTSNPFDMTPDPSAVFWTSAHREALAGLTYAVTRRKGFVVLTGAAGTGKTTLLRKLIDSSSSNIRASYIYNPTLTPVEFLELALADFDMPHGPMNKAQRLLKLEQFLLETHRAGQVAVLIIDEAHKLSPDLLEEVRLLTNFETSKQKLLQIVLAGQPELSGVLNGDNLWQLKQRIAVRLNIRPLSESEISQYLMLRWTKAGGREPLPFDKAAIDLIASASKGIPRMINGICDNALLVAFGAGRINVSFDDVREVIRDLDLRLSTPREQIMVNGTTPTAITTVRTAPAPSPMPGPVLVVSQPVASRNGKNGAGAGVRPTPDPVEPSFRSFDQYEQGSFLARWAEKIGLRTRATGVSK